MKEYLITLDTGTTNTRASLWCPDGTYLGAETCAAGVRDTAVDGSNRRLKEKIGSCLGKLIGARGVSWEQVEGIFASGMISSNVGLTEVPHLTAPASKKDFAAHLKMESFPEIAPVPFYFIRGLKNHLKDWENLDKMDIMRGEEVETLALLEEVSPETPCVLILPGSHTKFVFVSGAQEITGCLTSLTGELLETVTNHTILADAVEKRFVSKETYIRDAVLSGYRAAKEQGFGRAAFLTRIHRMFGEESSSAWAANFLLGTVLWNDAAALRGTFCEEDAALRGTNCADGAVLPGIHTNDAAAPVIGIVAGKEPFLSGLADVLREDGFLKTVIKHEMTPGPSLSARGAFSVAMEWSKQKR